MATMGITAPISQRPQWPQWESQPQYHSAPSGHNGNYTHNITAPPVATTGMTLLKVTAPPNGQNRNDTPMETMTVTEPPSGHNGNDTPLMVIYGHSAPQWPQ